MGRGEADSGLVEEAAGVGRRVKLEIEGGEILYRGGEDIRDSGEGRGGGGEMQAGVDDSTFVHN